MTLHPVGVQVQTVVHTHSGIHFCRFCFYYVVDLYMYMHINLYCPNIRHTRFIINNNIIVTLLVIITILYVHVYIQPVYVYNTSQIRLEMSWFVHVTNANNAREHGYT